MDALLLLGWIPFPARAGMNRRDRDPKMTVTSVPRTRGDEPAAERFNDSLATRSPHARG